MIDEKRDGKNYNKNANQTVNKIVIVYLFVKLLFYIFTVEGNYWVARLIASVLVLLIILPLNNTSFLHRRISVVLVPFVLAVMESVACIVVDGDLFYYTFLSGSVAVCFIYMDTIGLSIYLFLINILACYFTFVLMYPMLGEKYDFKEAVYNFAAFEVISIIFYLICRNSEGKYKEFEEDGRTYEQIMENTPNFMVVTNEQTEVRYISRTLLEWLGLQRVRCAVNRPLVDLFPLSEMKMMFHEVMEAGGYVEKNFEITIKDKVYWFMLRSSRLGEGRLARFYEWSDVTSFMEAKNAAEETSKSKSDFLARMSHEIRTPMNAIVGMSELIIRKELPQDVYENAIGIKGASMNLLSIINDILDFSKIESGRMEIMEGEYQIASLLNDVISIIRTRLMEQPICFTVNVNSSIPNLLLGDEVRIRQILLNLLSNAVKYTKEGTVSLDVSSEKDGEGIFLVIKVADSGIGIKKEDLNKLFGNFVQVDVNNQSRVEGTGLGLAITQNLCHMMGGKIEVESEYGEGSVFTVTLPQKVKEDNPIVSKEDVKGKAVLLYETREPYAKSIVRTLEDMGIPYKRVYSVSVLHEEAEYYSHMFLPLFMYDKMNTLLTKIEKKIKLVLIADINETYFPQNVSILIMPVHALSVVHALNDLLDSMNEVCTMDASFAAPKARILVVDDIIANLRVAEGLMSPYQMLIDTCKSGREAIELVKSETYDVIFMDHMMPEMDGIETTRQIRRLEEGKYKNVPIIALTANAVSGMRDMFIQNGMDDFLSKPIETMKLDAMLEKWIPDEKKEEARALQMNKPDIASGFLLELRELSTIEMDRALKVMGGQKEVYEDNVKLSIRTMIEKVDILNELLEIDLSRYAIEVHGVKGMLNSIGAYTLGKTAAVLETLSKNGDRDSVVQLHPEFNNDINEFVASIMPLINKYEAMKEEGNYNDFLEKLISVEEAAGFYDSALALDVLSELNKYTYGKEVDEALKELIHAFEGFDFDEAEKIINHLKEGEKQWEV